MNFKKIVSARCRRNAGEGAAGLSNRRPRWPPYPRLRDPSDAPAKAGRPRDDRQKKGRDEFYTQFACPNELALLLELVAALLQFLVAGFEIFEGAALFPEALLEVANAVLQIDGDAAGGRFVRV